MPFVPENRPPRSPKRDTRRRTSPYEKPLRPGKLPAAEKPQTAEQVPERIERTIPQQAGTRITHHAPHPFPHGYFVAMNGAFLANRFPVAEPTAIQPDNGIREQFPTLRTKLPVPFPVDTVKTDHPLDDPLLIVYPPPRKNHTSDLTITQLAANQLSTNLEYGTVQKRSLPPYPFSKPPGHLAIPPYQSILYKYNQIVRIFVFYPDAVYSRLREIPSPHNMLF